VIQATKVLKKRDESLQVESIHLDRRLDVADVRLESLEGPKNHAVLPGE
jgi:hypothetical protein